MAPLLSTKGQAKKQALYYSVPPLIWLLNARRVLNLICCDLL